MASPTLNKFIVNKSSLLSSSSTTKRRDKKAQKTVAKEKMNQTRYTAMKARLNASPRQQYYRRLAPVTALVHQQ